MGGKVLDYEAKTIYMDGKMTVQLWAWHRVWHKAWRKAWHREWNKA